MKYWLGTMNRIATSEDDSYPISKENWEEHKHEWHEISKEMYDEIYVRIWDEACNTFWHC